MEVARRAETGKWPSLATLVAGVGAIGGVLLHLVGVTANQTYLQQWGLDAAMFPKPTDETLVLGYYALWDASLRTLAALVLEHGWWLILYAALFGAAALVPWAVSFVDLPSGRLPRWIERHRSSAIALTTAFMSFIVVAVVVPLALFTVLLVLALPIKAGDDFGNKLVRTRLLDFEGGCGSATSTSRCATLVREGKLVASGFLIAASASHVALYDPAAKKVRLQERVGASMDLDPNRLALPPTSDKAAK